MEGMATQHAFSKYFSRCANGEGLIDASNKSFFTCMPLGVLCSASYVTRTKFTVYGTTYM